MLVSYQDITAARSRIRDRIHETPCFTSQQFQSKYCPEKNIYFKCDNLQKCGSFKTRGALNAVSKLVENDPSVETVVTASSGNFGQALAYAARLYNLTCYVVCPSNTVQAKKDAAKEYGARLIECEPAVAAPKQGAEKIRRETGATFVNSSADKDVIAGQGTAGLEIIDQVSEIDAVLVPLGGGGLTSGVAVAIKHVYPNAKIFGIEPETANDAHLSFTNKRLIPNATYPTTICDGLRTSLSDITLQHILNLVDDVILVSDRDTVEATKFILSRMKLCVEPSGAIGVAALMNQENVERYLGSCKNIVVIISGGNFDLIAQSHLLK